MGRERKQERGVEPRGNSIRITFHFAGERRRETLKIPPTAPNLRYAELKRNQILYEIEIGSFVYGDHFPNSKSADLGRRRTNLTVSQGVANWLATRKLTPSTKRGYEMSIRNYITPAFGSRVMRSLLPSELEMKRAAWAEQLAPKTVNNALIPLRGAFDLAHADGILKTNPAVRLKNVKVSRVSQADPFSPAELKAILEAMEPQARNFFEFWSLTGLRTGEIIAIEWRDVDWQQSRLQVRRSITMREVSDTKTHRERFVDLVPHAIEVLNRQRAYTALANKEIFHNPFTLAPWSQDKIVGNAWSRYCTRAKVRHRPPIQLRHTYASLALSAGEAPMYVAKQLGHTTLQMLDRHYGRWMRSAATDAGAKFGAAAAGFKI